MKKVLVSTIGLLAVFCAFALFGEQFHDTYINSANKYVVKLTNSDGTHGGTGFYVTAPSGDTYIMTNEHVCGLAERGSIVVDMLYLAPVVAIYPKHDLCLIYNPTNKSGLKVAKSASSGDNIYVVGHPLLLPKSLTKGQLTDRAEIEVVMGENMKCDGPDRREVDFFGIAKFCLRRFDAGPTTANILPGNSGSPVLDIYRHVVGVAFAGENGTARGFIVPLVYVQDFLSKF